ncbi:GMC oxidoreductase [Nioella aestuarii]|uniref:GMC oxidoreductase n=1 Tax=Nioella aestuarii TaxID=1662864 RepID=UPI003D7FD3F1
MQAQISDIRDTHWDAIVIGTGVGGGVAGRALAEAGMKVLFLEKGRAGFRAEETALDLGMGDPVARAIRGFWAEPISVTLKGHTQELFAPLGSGPGGSSVFYAATLERPEPHDLDNLPDRPHPTGGWPIGFDAMRPWFDAAQSMFHLHGEPDPLSRVPCPSVATPHPTAPGDAMIMDRLRGNGLHPYRLHTAVKRLDGCKDCLGHKCPRACKMDGRSAGLEPALATGNAAILTGCEVTRLVRNADGSVCVEACQDGQSEILSARHVVLAAGALSSPRLLLASQSDQDPNGIGNGADLVGRNLMFHLNEIFALWPGKAASFAGPSKSVGFRDLYFVENQRLGMVQAMGIDVGYGEIVHHLRGRVARSWIRRIPGALDMTRIPAAIGAKLMGTAKVFVGLLEDLPYAENRVVLDEQNPGRIQLEYRVSDELLARRKLFRRLIRKSFKGIRTAFLTHEPEPNFGHPCGTLRMGSDAGDSVVNTDCRVHDVHNLWVADASVFPTSMGVNPSLTIAANALRVADRIKDSR